MSPRLPAVTSRELVPVLRKLGFVLDRQSGSHAVYYRDEDKARVVVPMHAGKTIKPKTLASILYDAGIGPDELTSLL